MGHVKQASRADLSKAAALLDRIYSENPAHWPNGLTVDHFAPGDLFLVQKSASEEPVGFVGWQQRDLGGLRAGFYSVGMLPSARGKGIAKQAVAKLVAEKSAGVDRVYALVVPGNEPSEKLAARLGIPILKTAGKVLDMAKWVAPRLAGGSATMLMQDNLMNDGGPFDAVTNVFDNNKHRNLMNLINFGMGFGGAHLTGTGYGLRQQGHKVIEDFARSRSRLNPNALARGIANGSIKTEETGRRLLSEGAHRMELGATGMTVAPMAKDLMMDSHRAISAVDRMSRDVPKALRESAGGAQQVISQAASDHPVLAAGLIAAALGAGGYGIAQAIKNQAPSTINMEQGGRLKVTLPTKNPGDAETTVELPYDPQASLTNALRNRIDLDTRRRLYAETRSRINRRNMPKPDLQVA